MILLVIGQQVEVHGDRQNGEDEYECEDKCSNYFGRDSIAALLLQQPDGAGDWFLVLQLDHILDFLIIQ